MSALFLLDRTVKRDPEVASWLAEPDILRALARHWFLRMRRCGADVREAMHDGQPTACVGKAAFAYVDTFRTHVNVGFFYGATLKDPAGLLIGAGKRMRHVKLRPGVAADEKALAGLIDAAYTDIRLRLAELT